MGKYDFIKTGNLLYWHDPYLTSPHGSVLSCESVLCPDRLIQH